MIPITPVALATIKVMATAVIAAVTFGALVIVGASILAWLVTR